MSGAFFILLALCTCLKGFSTMTLRHQKCARAFHGQFETFSMTRRHNRD